MVDITGAKQILKAAKTILLVDWPSPGVPRALVDAGFTVYGYSPNRYSVAELIDDGTGIKKMVFKKLDSHPDSVGIVNVFRPEEELKGIIENHVLPLGAKTLWLHPPVTSAWARNYAAEHGVAFVEGIDIAEIARTLEAG